MKTQQNQSGTWYQSLKNAFYDAYQGITNTLTSPFRSLYTWWTGENQDKVKLEQMRNKYYDRLDAEENKPHPDYVKITKDISQDTRQYVNKIIDEEIQKLGPLPCKFSVVTLGSLAREESGPITDLEIGFLIENKNVDTYKYFYDLSQRLSDRLFLLGEHPDIGGKGLRIDEADNAPPHLKFFARNLSPEQNQQLLADAIKNREWDKIPYEGSRPFLATPEEFASYTHPDFKQNRKQLAKQKHQAYKKELNKALNKERKANGSISKKRRSEIENEVRFWINNIYRPFSSRETKIANEAGKRLGRNMDHLYGDKALTKQFLDKKANILAKITQNGQTQRQALARELMVSDINDRIQKGKSIFVTGKVGKTLDLKRDLYRFIEQFVTNMGFYHNLNTQNTHDIVEQLMKKKHLDPRLGYELQDIIQFATKMRLKQQKLLQRQGFASYIDQEAFDEDKQDLEEEMQRLEDSIAYLESANQDQESITKQKRALNALKIKYDHLLDMAPGKILSAQDVQLIKDKYIPMSQKLFKAAQDWANNPNSLKPKVPAQTKPKQTRKRKGVQSKNRPKGQNKRHQKAFLPSQKPKAGSKKRTQKPSVAKTEPSHIQTSAGVKKVGGLLI